MVEIRVVERRPAKIKFAEICLAKICSGQVCDSADCHRAITYWLTMIPAGGAPQTLRHVVDLGCHSKVRKASSFHQQVATGSDSKEFEGQQSQRWAQERSLTQYCLSSSRPRRLLSGGDSD